MKHRIGLYFLTSIFLILSACSTPTLYETAKSNTEKTQSQTEDIVAKANNPAPAVLTENAPYVDTTPMKLESDPAWMKKSITLHGNNLPFSFYVAQILNGSNVINHYDDSIKLNKSFSMDYSGTAKGALNQLSALSGYHYEFDNKTDSLNWSGFETKVFDISFMPGNSEYQLGQTAGSIAISGSGGSGGGSSSGSGSSTGGGFDFSQDTQFSNLKGSLSIWKDLAATIQNLLSKEGTATVSQSSTTVTVHDHLENVAAIGKYIDSMNEELSRQVRIHVQLLEVELSKNFNYGINWDLVRNKGNNSWAITGNLADNANNISTFSPVGLTFASTGGRWDQSESVIQALQQQGNVSLVTQPTITTLNDQVATISIQKQQAYLSGGSGSLNDNTSSTSINTSMLTTGFNLYLLPRIQGDKIFLQVSSILSNLEEMQTFNAITGSTGTSSTTPASNDNTNDSQNSSSSTTDTSTTNQIGPQVVQEPVTALRSFNQRSVIPNGATLVLAGFIQKQDSSNESKFANITLLGGQGAETKNVELVMLITPVVLDSNENDMAPNRQYHGGIK